MVPKIRINVAAAIKGGNSDTDELTSMLKQVLRMCTDRSEDY